MEKLINGLGDSIKETMEGVIYAYGDKVRLLDGDKRISLTNYPAEQGRVGIVTTGGGDHLPVLLGYVGQGVLDGCAMDNVFVSPSTEKMADMIKACDHDNGVLCLYGNYGGGNMNFDMACEMVEMDDVRTRTVRVKDDVASNPGEAKEEYHGVARMVYGFKAADVTAERVTSLGEVVVVAEKTLDNIRAMGVALSPYAVSQVDEPTFKIGDDEIEIEMGIHREKGTEMKKMMTVDEVTKTPVDRIAQDMPLIQGNEVSVLVSGLGTAPMEEQLIMYRCVCGLLTEKEVKIIMPHIDEYVTSMEMVDLSVTIFKLDEQSEELLTAPVKVPSYTNLNKQSLIRRLESWIHHL